MAIRIIAIWALIMFLLMGCRKPAQDPWATRRPCQANEYVVYDSSTHELKCKQPTSGPAAWSTITSADGNGPVTYTGPQDQLSHAIDVLSIQSRAKDDAIREETAMIQELCHAAPLTCMRSMDKHKRALDAAFDKVIEAK